MEHSFRVGLLAVGLALATPAAAQFGSIFSDPPRPPSQIPNRPPPLGLPQQMPPEEMDEDAQVLGTSRAPQTATRPLPPPPGAVRAQPLPPLPGSAPPDAQAARTPGLQPGQTVPPIGQPPTRHSRPPAPANTAPQPGDEVITEMPSQKITNPTAVFAGLDKITGRIIAFDVAINETVQFGALQVTPHVCYTRPPTEAANTDVFVEVDEVTLQGEVKRIFAGWMFATSPGLHAVEHPIYDVWLTDCKGGAAVAADTQPVTPSARPPQRPATSGPRQSATASPRPVPPPSAPRPPSAPPQTAPPTGAPPAASRR
ncbi:MAG TPA: DUF2155 domain-containing protein [Xanthobacteraceae bacterium]